MTPELMSCPILCSSLAGYMNIVIIVKNAYRNLRKNCCACLITETGASKCDSSSIGIFINCVRSSEAFRKYHMVKLPMVYAVHINNSLNRLNCINSSRFKVHPVNRTKENLIKRRISRYKLHFGCFFTGFNLEYTNHYSGITGIIGNFKSNSVITVSNCNILSSHNTAGIRNRYFNTVNSSLCT